MEEAGAHEGVLERRGWGTANIFLERHPPPFMVIPRALGFNQGGEEGLFSGAARGAGGRP